MFQRPDVIKDKLYAISPLFNPQGYRTRWKRYKDFAKHIIDSGAHLVTIEAAFAERENVIKEEISENHTVITVRTNGEIWLKENLMNRAAQEIAAEGKYLAFIDGDMHFARPDWVGETLRQLQHHPVVQMFSEVCYLGPDSQIINSRLSFAERWMRGYTFNVNGKKHCNKVFHHKRGHHHGKNCHSSYHDPKTGEWGPPGGAWAFRRHELELAGGLIDFCILGSGDWYMAAGMAGFAEDAIPKAYSEDLRRMILLWEKRALIAFRKNIGVVPGTIFHNWHGKMKDRRYSEREAILKELEYSPISDLRRNLHGIVQLFDDGSERMRLLRDQARSYMDGRNEDSTDL
jgi:hypothetical protein